MDARTIDAFTRLSDTLDRVRKECPWDKVQTIQSLRYLTLEEVYELSEAIVSLSDNGGNDDFKKELGDLFMHLMFYSKIAEEEGRFSLADVLNAISDKLVTRHPHIFSPDKDQHQGWEQLKMREGRKSAMEGVPTSLPSEQSGTEEEFGDLLFALVKWGAMRGINADDALCKTNRKFIYRFRQVERTAASQGKSVSEMTKEEMLQAWREAK